MIKHRFNYAFFKVGCGLVVAVLVLATGSLAFLPRRTLDSLYGRVPSKAELVADVGGDRAAAALTNADRVTAVQLTPPLEEPLWEAHRFQIASDEIKVDSTVACEIATTLLSPDLQRDYPPVSCIPVYDVRLSYFAENERVDVYLCFECSLLSIYLNGELVGGLNFSFSYRDLITAVQKTYPNDAKLSKLGREWRD